MPQKKKAGISAKAKKIWHLVKRTFIEFDNDNAIKLSASLSYYTIFALPPLLIIIIAVCGIFLGSDAVSGELFGQIDQFVGNKSALAIQNMVKNVKLNSDNAFTATIGVATLLVGASAVFAEIQSSINYIWGLQAKPKKGFVKFLKNRLMSFSMIGCLGFLFMVSLLLNTFMDLLSDHLAAHFPKLTVNIFYVANICLVFIITTLLFFLIFRTLPDGKVPLKDTLLGSSLTALLFMFGKFAISTYLGNSDVSTTYGAAGSIIIILVWVYYSAIILYLGAEFTKVYTNTHGRKIDPNEYAVIIDKEQHEIEPRKNVEK